MVVEPAHAQGLVARPRLAARIAAALDLGSVLLVAPAGYAKTTALREALATREGPVVWLSCATTGGDVGLLALALIEQLGRVVPGSADVLSERLGATLHRLDAPAVARALRAELELLLVEAAVVVLDDAEQLSDSADAVEMLDILLGADPRALRVAVASRRGLGLRLGKLRATGRVVEVGAEELAFSAHECAAVLRLRAARAPTPAEVETVMDGTGGWPLGVALSAVSAGHPGTSPRGGRDAVFAFLDEEVLAEVDPELRRGVLDIALAPDLGAGLLSALGLPAELPARAQRAGLVLRSNGDRAGSTFHPLVREFLRARLTAERSPAELAALHTRIAEVLYAEDRGREAVEHWLDAGNWSEALRVAAGLGRQLQHMSPERIRGWLARLPPEARSEPAAQLVLGRVEWGAGRHEQALIPLRAAVTGYDARADPLRAWSARWLLCDVLFSTGGFDEIERLAEGWDDPALAALGPRVVAVGWWAAFVLLSRGRFDEAAPLLQRLRADATLAPHLHHLDQMFTAFGEIAGGRVETALRRMDAAVATVTEQEQGDRATYVLATAALVQTDCGRTTEALATWERLAAEATRAGLAFAVNTARWERAFLLAETGQLAAAEHEMQRAGSPAGGGWHDRSFHKARAAIALRHLEPEEAVVAAELALALVAPVALNLRVYTTCEVAPILAAAGAPQLAHDALRAALAALDAAFPGRRGRYSRARLLAVRARIFAGEGELARALGELRRAWEQARGCEHHLLRAERVGIEPLLAPALELGTLDVESVVGALQRAFPGGAALVPFVEHPRADVRRAALPAAIASGHPQTLDRVVALAQDRDPGVSAMAVAAWETLRRSPPPLAVTVLGGFEVRRGRWTLENSSWGGPLVARLVRFLLVHHEASTHEAALFEAFWPGKDPPAARRSLAVALSLARKALDVPGGCGSLIVTDGRAHQVRLRDVDRLDVDVFEAAATAALVAAPQESEPLLERAIALWGGEPLPEDRHAEWSLAWRERLTDRYSQLLITLTQRYSQAGRPEDALRSARRLVELDPLNEAAQRELMASYARAGRRNHALRQYLSCRRSLVDALGIEPAEATRELQERILAGTPV